MSYGDMNNIGSGYGLLPDGTLVIVLYGTLGHVNESNKLVIVYTYPSAI